MLRKAQEMGVCFHSGSVWRAWGEGVSVPFLGPSRKG
jgi:hypothetical protein